ncbi:MAG: hypothetical protein OHK0029_35450 [Armatimonadaceae bacterium]
MTVVLSLPSELEEQIRREAREEHRSVEEIVVRRLQEAELLRRIFSYLPPDETAEMRSLVRKQKQETLTENEKVRFIALSQQREEENAARLSHLMALARLRGVSLRQVMQELGIRPHRVG